MFLGKSSSTLRRIAAVLLAICLIVPPLPVQVTQASTAASVVISNLKGRPGQVAKIAVSVSGYASLTSYGITLQYDPAVLSPVPNGAENGEILADSGFAFNLAFAPNQVKLANYQATAASMGTTLCTVDFTVNPDAVPGTTTSVQVVGALLFDGANQQITTSSVHGGVEILDLSPVPQLTVSDSINQVNFQHGGSVGTKVAVPNVPVVGTVAVATGTLLSESRILVNPVSLAKADLVNAWAQGLPMSGETFANAVDLTDTLNQVNTLVLVSKAMLGDEAFYGVSSPLYVLPDTSAPIVADLKLNGGSGSTKLQQVDVTFQVQATDIAEMRVANTSSNLGSATWMPIATSFTHALADGESGPRTVYLQVRDDIGNDSDVASASISYIASLASGSVSINSGAQYATATEVTLTIAPPEFADKMMVSNDPQFANSTWQDIVTTFAHTLTTGDGEKLVYVKFGRSELGLESTPIHDSITLDTSKPTVSITTPTDGALLNTKSVTVTGTVDTGCTVKVNGTGANVIGVSYTATVTLEEGSNTITVVGRDAAGNESNPVTHTVMVDTIKPSVPIIGEPADGALLNTKSVTVTGTVEAGCQVKVNDSDYQVGTGTSYSVTVTLAEGANTITVVAKDAAGNESDAATRQVTVDTIAPAAPTVVVAGGKINLANVGQVKILGTAEVGSEVKLELGGITEQVDVSAAGTYEATVDASSLQDATEIVVEATATDLAGNSSEVTTISVLKDTIVPALQDISPANGATVGSLSVTVSGSLTESGCRVLVNGVEATVSEKSFTKQVEFPSAGTDKSVTITVTDAAGNTGVSVTHTFTIDTSIPTFSISIDQESPVKAGVLTITVGKASAKPLNEDGYAVTIKLPGEETPIPLATKQLADGSFEYTISPTAPNGTTVITVSATDDTGLYGESTLTLDIDTEQPNAPTLTVGDGWINALNQTTLTVTGTAEAGATVTVSAGQIKQTAMADAEGDFSLQIDASGLADSPTATLTATATDTAGNTSDEGSVSVVKDTVAPNAPTVTVVGGKINKASAESVQVTGVAEAGSSVQVTLGSLQQSVAAASDTGAFTATFNASELGDGDVAVSAAASDQVGNIGPATATTVVKDTAAPNAPTGLAVVSGFINVANQSTVQVNGSAEAGSIVTVTLSSTNESLSDTATAASDGSFAVTFTDVSSLAEGQVTVTAFATDAHENNGISASIQVMKDTVRPATPSDLTSAPYINAETQTDVEVSVTAEADTDVIFTLTDKDSQVITVSAEDAATGAFTKTVNTSSLADGEITIRTWAVDSVGNKSDEGTITVTKDTVAPAKPTNLTVTGGRINVANVDNVAISVTAEVGSTVTLTLSDGTVSLTAETLPGDEGLFTSFINAQTLADNTNITITATSIDAAGNTGEACWISVAKDAVAPRVLAAFSPEMNKVLGLGQKFNLKAVVDSPGAVHYSLQIENGDVLVADQLMSANNGMYEASYTVAALGEAKVVGKVWMIDEAGNLSAEQPFSFFVDTVAPSVTAVSHGDKDVYRAGEKLVVTINAEQGLSVTVDIGSHKTGLRANWQTDKYTLEYTVPASANASNLTITVTAKDSAGNVTQMDDLIAISLDSSVPISSITITGIPNGRGYRTSAETATITVNELADLHYQLGSGDVTTILSTQLVQDGNVYKSQPIALIDGVYDITYYAVDVAGNTETAKVYQGIKVDTQRPTVTLVIDEDSINTTTRDVTVGGATENGAAVTLYRVLGNGSRVRLATATGTAGAWTAGTILLAGENNLVAVAQDAAGNSSDEATDSYFLDSRGPVFTISVVGQEITVTSDEALAADTLRYELMVDDNDVADFVLAPAAEPLKWTGTLPAGTKYDFVVEGKDASNNLGIGVYSVNNVNAAQGATVGGDHITVYIAPNALTQDLGISIGSSDGDTAEFENAGNTVTGTAHYRPDGTEFSTPARITMPIDPNITDTRKVVVFYLTAQGQIEDLTSRIVSIDLDKHTVTFEVDHFSVYGTGVDLTPPTLSLTAPVAGSFTNASTVVVSGTTDGISVSMSVDGGAPVSQPVASGAFNLSANLTPNKANEIVVTVADQAGNTTSETLTVNHDSVKPALGVTTADQTTAAATADLTVTVNDTNQVTLTVGGTSTVLAGGQQQQRVFTVSLAEGPNQFSIRAVDQAGNEETDSITISKDTNCALTVTSPANGDITASATVDVIGTADPGATVNVDNLSDQEADFTAVAGQNGAYSVQVTLVAGDNDLVVSAEDSLHNQSNTISLSVERNNDVPVVTIQPVISPTKSTTVTISGTVSSPTDLVSVTYAAPSGSGVITPEQNGSFSATVSLVEGANTITVVAVNAAGTAQVSTAVVSDNTAPTIALTAPTAGQTISTQTTVVSGSLNEAGTVQISVGGSNHNVTTSGAEHSFSQQVTLARGQNTITITAGDALGNSSTETVTVSCTYAPADSGSGTTQPPAQTHDKEIKPTELSKSSKTETSTAGQTVTTTITVTNTLLQAAANNAKTQGQPVVLTLPTVEQANDPQTTADGKPITRLAKLTLSDAQVGTVAGTGLAVQGPNGTLVQLPQALLNAVAAANTGLELAISRVPNEVAQSALNEGDEALFAQEIDTNFSGSTTLRFLAPEGVDVADLKMHVKHSDGTEEDIVPVAVTGADGKTYLEIAVDRFSTFILYKAAKPVEPPVTPTEKTIVLTVGKQGASIDGKAYQMDATPYVQANTGRTLVPIRFVTEAIGAKVEWLAATKQVRITDGDTVILLTIGSKTATVNGKAVTIDAPATLTNARTFVPLRFISETLGADVVYTAATKSITISR